MIISYSVNYHTFAWYSIGNVCLRDTRDKNTIDMGWKWHHVKCHSAPGLDSKRCRESWARHSRIAIDCPHDGQIDGPVFVSKRSGKEFAFYPTFVTSSRHAYTPCCTFKLAASLGNNLQYCWSTDCYEQAKSRYKIIMVYHDWIWLLVWWWL